MGTKETTLIRAVLDTNVLISCVVSKARLWPLVAAWQERRFVFLISEEIFEEYATVLTYEKFGLTMEEIRLILERDLRPYLTQVKLTHRHPPPTRDLTDTKFFACAVAGAADYLVTGDRQMLAVSTYRGVTIIPPQRFLALLPTSAGPAQR